MPTLDAKGRQQTISPCTFSQLKSVLRKFTAPRLTAKKIRSPILERTSAGVCSLQELAEDTEKIPFDSYPILSENTHRHWDKRSSRQFGGY